MRFLTTGLPLAVLGAALLAAAPAEADRGRDRGWRAPAGGYVYYPPPRYVPAPPPRHWHRPPPRAWHAPPGYYYAPPPRVYYPPPRYYHAPPPPPGASFYFRF